VVRQRRGTWFDPELADAFLATSPDDPLWERLASDNANEVLRSLEPEALVATADEEGLDRVSEAFASVIDAKSHFTHEHSVGVATYAVGIGEELGFDAVRLRWLRRAALLHDIGKLGVPNSVLDKAGALTDSEWSIVREHPTRTLEILQAVPVFQDFAFDAACHHERLDGSGYPRGLAADRLSPSARALAVADVADALLAERPYRPSLNPEEALRTLKADCARGALCRSSVFAIADIVANGGTMPNAETATEQMTA